MSHATSVLLVDPGNRYVACRARRSSVEKRNHVRVSLATGDRVPPSREWAPEALPVLARMDRRTLIEQSRLHRRTIERYIDKHDAEAGALLFWRMRTTVC